MRRERKTMKMRKTTSRETEEDGVCFRDRTGTGPETGPIRQTSSGDRTPSGSETGPVPVGSY